MASSSTLSTEKAANSGSSGGKCTYCWEPAKQRCAKCRGVGQEVFYCGKECQTKDWKDHKHFCALPFPEKKLTNSVYGILLRENATKPEVVEVPINARGFGSTHLVLGVDQYVQGVKYMFNNFYKDKKGNLPKTWRDARQLDNTLLFHFNDNFMNDGSALNKCIQTITAGKAAHKWAGPMVVTKIKGEDMLMDPPEYRDITLADGADIVAHSLFYNSKYNLHVAEQQHGVKFNEKGEVEF